MPKSSPQELKTKAEYNKRPDVQAKRVENNRARREAIREGRAKVGDGKDVHHVKMQDKTGPQKRGKTEVVSQKDNRGWRKDNPEAYGNGKK
jgi:hypothetical protein